MAGKNSDKIIWLKRYIGYKAECESLSDIINQCTDDYSGIKGFVLSDMPSGSRDTSSPQEKFVTKYSGMVSYYIKRREEMLNAMEEIEHAIESLDDPIHRTVLRCKYINDMKWNQIADLIPTSVSNCKGYIHGKALNELKINTL